MLIVDNYYLAIQNNTREYDIFPFFVSDNCMLLINITRYYNIHPFAIIY